MTTRFTVAAPSEELVLTFDFAAGLDGAETLATPTVTVEVDAGVDSAPQDIYVTATVSGETVLVAVHNMVQDCDYHITVVCTTSNSEKTLALAGILPCRRA